MYQGSGKGQPLFHAVRITFSKIVDKVFQPEAFDLPGNALLSQSRVQAEHIGNELQKLSSSQLVIQVGHIWDIAKQSRCIPSAAADIVATNADRARGRPH